MIVLVLAGVATARVSIAQAPLDYYASAEGKTGDELRRALHEIVDGHAIVSYSSPASFDAVATLEADPSREGHILTIYMDASRPALDHSQSGWHREHLWPDSYGFDAEAHGEGARNAPLGDLHALRAGDPGYNSSRGNAVFGFAGPNGTPRPVATPGIGMNWRQSGDPAVWEVWPERRGDVARALFYMDVRYDGTPSSPDGHEPDLVLVGDPTRVKETDDSPAYMGRLCDLLTWHKLDPPSTPEVQRNNRAQGLQGNRNPFVDEPGFAARLWSCARSAAVYFPYTTRSSEARHVQRQGQ